jgi:hypothetical protein
MNCQFITIRVLCLAAFLLTIEMFHAQQNQTAAIFKKYIVRDTSKFEKDAMLILYTNNTYLNFGIYSNQSENDSYIWYSCGTWQNTDNVLALKTKFDIFESDFLKKGIKFYYKRRKDYVLIDTYYEFVKELYKSKDLKIEKDDLIDTQKTISYLEINI